ncbi:hypothetical protein HJG54_08020 [Leptolyngbya sp. NK1-12]|uniref:Uncharacterized protein n=1 Tax=Leptolyngbya sp. NK1-12 TaxID=2547451 RepID=A0AA96WIH3_9CYAN|nr:hypothetical protein [Leptolyngbya sp. NK1-12]WNZ22806.1 hypothetical protein HJG54_08020 [Leptolyngbya sp. NK1-12]
MSFSKHLLSSVLLAGTIFAAATIPLATLGSKPVAIQLEGKPVFTGQFKELAAPYMGLVLALSIGAGATNFAVMRWCQSSRKLNLAESEMSTLKQQLHEQETLIETLKFSPARLQASGLERFLPEGSNWRQRGHSANGEGKNEHSQVAFETST